ncbi:hypothetical protein Lfu02_21300 [Longispora fulva]|uniref:Uncharacterized protein n=1 Tax=Longispora fulva TaxID=619741 RepID=A0A8J7KSP4_9ACTN|nr:hypothetical protein [Longispora fulva]MBG6139857.1 hypothetical protein [Longispora fulva]GIG57758.1 hypothetical protein Lfu02_21300 [Longispora fulva]
MTRNRAGCPDWCRGHGCALGEHRAHPVRLQLPNGSAVLTRVAGRATQHAEVRLSVRLPADDTAAQHRLLALLFQLQTLTATLPEVSS